LVSANKRDTRSPAMCGAGAGVSNRSLARYTQAASRVPLPPLSSAQQHHGCPYLHCQALNNTTGALTSVVKRSTTPRVPLPPSSSAQQHHGGGTFSSEKPIFESSQSRAIKKHQARTAQMQPFRQERLRHPATILRLRVPGIQIPSTDDAVRRARVARVHARACACCVV